MIIPVRHGQARVDAPHLPTAFTPDLAANIARYVEFLRKRPRCRRAIAMRLDRHRSYREVIKSTIGGWRRRMNMLSRATASSTAIWIGALFATASNAHAAWPKTAADFAALPPYCKARLKPANQLERETWSQRLGEGFLHVHHYCAALHTLNQSYRAKTSYEKKDMLGEALHEIAYVEKNAPANFPLRREIALKKQQIMLMIKMLPR